MPGLRKTSLGIVDAAFAKQRDPDTSKAPRNAANKEVALSMGRNKALARLGAAEDGMSAFEAQPGKRKSGRMKPLLPLKFSEPDVEAEYRLTAYLMHRSFLVWLMLLFALTYTVVGVTTLYYDSTTSYAPQAESGAYIAAFALRLAAATLSLLVAILVTCCEPSLVKAETLIALALLLLWVSPLAAALLRGMAQECPELIVIYFTAYGVLCPAFHIRLVTGACLTLTGLQVLSLVLCGLYEGTQQALLLHALLRELFKAVVFNMMGVWLARRSERAHRETFVNAKLFQEELILRKAICSDVQRLLLNTLPEPIVREIASGERRVAHRYSQVTVLQADMVGFTPLSAARGPEEVLGILSELFEAFDQAAERWGVHKVKTIGDAYIVCCGAFDLKDDQAKAATRVVSMALTMQYIVSQKAFERGVDISVRIGVHTGMVIGGVIGTVRFHWDMWGNGVAGAVRLEELGQRGRVHISDVTSDLIEGHFPVTPNMHAGRKREEKQGAPNTPTPTGDGDGDIDKAAAALAETFGIRATYFIKETEIKMADYAPKHEQAHVSTEYDFSEILNVGGHHDRHDIDHLVTDSDPAAAAARLSRRDTGLMSKIYGMLALPSVNARRQSVSQPEPSRIMKQRRNQKDKGTGQVTNAIAFMKSLTEDRRSARDGTEGGNSSNGGSIDDRRSINSNDGIDFREESVEEMTKATVNMESNFFVKKAEARHSTAFNASLAAKVADEELERLSEAQRFLMGETEMIVVIAVMFGLYDFLQGYYGAVATGTVGNLPMLLLVRYCALIPLLLLVRQLLVGTPTLNSTSRIHFTFAICLIAVLTGSFFGVNFVLEEDVRPCPKISPWTADRIPLCVTEGSSEAVVALAPPPPPPSVTAILPTLCAVANTSDVNDGSGYCKYGFATDYVTTLGMLSIMFSYMLVYARLSTVTAASISASVVSLIFIVYAQRYVLWNGQPMRWELAAWEWREMLTILLWWVLSHVCGWLHYRVRFINLEKSRLLRKRHQRLLALIREETEHCEKLLRNILPPHVLGHLGGLLASADNVARGVTMPQKMIAERYHDCSFLFAKIGGLSRLVNDAEVEPGEMMGVLQIIFDRFDALADMFGVQKVRKTANEYYLVAAGLPNTELLPSAEQRAAGIAGFGFAMINIMNILNIELADYGITFSCQVGIHSGAAIAGIIGHKTFQYDLCGDAVNTAARMCSYSKPGHVNISQATFELVKHRFGAIPRGELEVKGKGKMNTYFLLNMPLEQQEALATLSSKLNAARTTEDRWDLHQTTQSTASKRTTQRMTMRPKAAPIGTAGAIQPVAQEHGSNGTGNTLFSDRVIASMRSIVGST